MFENIKYIYVDLDGTTTNSSLRFSQRTIDAFKYLRNKGIKIGIITGRPIHTMQHELDTLSPELPTISMNGAIIYSKNRTIIDETSLPFESKQVIETLLALGFSFLIYTKDGIYSNTVNNSFFRKLFEQVENYPEKYRNFELEAIDGINWLKKRKSFKIVCCFDTEVEKDLLLEKLKPIGNIEIFASGDNMLDICPYGVNKGRAIKLMINALEIDQEELMVFGDNENDISMFQQVYNSVVMENAKEHVKNYARYITNLTCEEDGFADFVFKNL